MSDAGLGLTGVEPFEISCPYCGEVIEILIDPSVESQSYVEDCQVCCRPINMAVTMGDDGTPHVQASADDD
jgi:hypothetical protein